MTDRRGFLGALVCLPFVRSKRLQFGTWNATEGRWDGMIRTGAKNAYHHDGKPCRCGPGVVHAPPDPQFVEKQIAKAADQLAKDFDRKILAELMAKYREGRL